MKLVDCVTTSALLLLLVFFGSVDASRLLAVLLPYDVYVARQEQRPQLSSRHRRGLSRSPRSIADHHFYLDRRSIQNCALAEEDENTFLAMDRLCEACHEMYRHTDPNLRANCRSNCFDNDDFVFCFNHFAGVEVTRDKRLT